MLVKVKKFDAVKHIADRKSIKWTSKARLVYSIAIRLYVERVRPESKT